MTFQTPGGAPGIVHWSDAEPILHSLLSDPNILFIGHNVSYDMGVACSNYPHLLPLVFKAYEDDRVTDTMLRQKLLDIAGGTYRGYLNPENKWVKVDYSLLACTRRHTGRMLKKDGFRLFYEFFRNVKLKDWPEEARGLQEQARQGRVILHPDQVKELPGMLAANPNEVVTYPLEDAEATLDVYLSQEKHKEFLQDEFRQARAAWWLHLMAAWGLHTDPAAVHDLRVRTEALYEDVKERLVSVGLVRKDGSRDTKKAKEIMEQVCVAGNLPLRLTPANQICLDSDACEATEDETLVDYAKFSTLGKVLKADVPMLLSGNVTPIHTHFGLAETGRTTSSAPNIQNLRRMPGIREVIRPRKGNVFIQADYDQLELRTLAQVCKELLGRSTLMEILNRGHDPHLEVARRIVGISYEEAKANKKRPDVDAARQAGKVANFGFPGGLGVKRLVYFAKHTYDVVLTEKQAQELKDLWVSALPEMKQFFEYVNSLPESEPGRRFMQQVFTKRFRGGVTFSAACIGYYQGLGADATKEAGWRIAKACYVDKTSPLYGCRPVCYVHDEFLVESPLDTAPEAAAELVRLMIEGAKKYLVDVNVTTEPVLMSAWSKEAVPVYDSNGRLIPWTLEMARVA